MTYDFGVISSFPLSEKSEQGGTARYIKQILRNFGGVNCKVYSERMEGEEENISNGITVTPTWSKGAIFPFAQIGRDIVENGMSKVLVNFEFGIFGGITNLFFLLLLLLYLKVKRITIIVIFHPAVLEYKEMLGISDHLNLNRKSLLLYIYYLGMRIYAGLLGMLSHTMITFENEFKFRLQKIGISFSKIHVIPHQIYGNAQATPLPKGKFTVLFFGFIVPYKGLDYLLEASQNIDKERIAIKIVGGRSPTAKNQRYFDAIVAKMKQHGIDHTDYVPDPEIPKFFRETHLLVLPYKNLMASSGPLAWAIGEGRPFIISSALKPYLKTEDFEEALQIIGIRESDIIFDLNPKDLADLITRLSKNPEVLNKLRELSLYLQQSRSLTHIVEKYKEVLS